MHDEIEGIWKQYWFIHQTWITISLELKDTEVRAASSLCLVCEYFLTLRFTQNNFCWLFYQDIEAKINDMSPIKFEDFIEPFQINSDEVIPFLHEFFGDV